MPRETVITGIGVVSAAGVGCAATWASMMEGVSRLGPITRFDAKGFASRLGGEAKDFSAKDFVPKSYRKAVKVMARDIELAVGAAKLAVEDAGLVTRGGPPDPDQPGPAMTYPGERMGCHIGAGLIAAEADELTMALATASKGGGREPEFDLRAWGTAGGSGGMNNLQPLWMLKYLPNMLACHVTIIHGAEGPSNTITCAEASGLLSLGESSRVIERDAADLCFSGGAESKVNLMGLARTQLMGRIAPTGDSTDASAFIRPYDRGASGTLIGEAGAILVLEEGKAASARGARVYARIAGFGAAHSTPAPRSSPDGGSRALPDVIAEYSPAWEGLRDAIERALADASLDAKDIDAIAPHALGSPGVDHAEAQALEAVFGGRLPEIPLITATPYIGDCFAGHAGVAAAVAAKCLAEQSLPARLHGGVPAPGLRAGASPPGRARLGHVLVCTSSLGGQNAALVLRAAG